MLDDISHGKNCSRLLGSQFSTTRTRMGRRVASRSSAASYFSSLFLNQQAASSSKISRSFTTEVVDPPPTKKHLLISFVLGGPGSGKGTQCAKIAKAFGYVHLSAGELLRREITSNSEDGALILNTIKDGNIVPSEVTMKLIKKELESNANYKFIIDGFPRNEENRIAFKQISGAEPDLVIFFDCPEEEMVKRVLNRNQGRVDDNIDTVKNRLQVFASSNLPVVNYYSRKGKLLTVNAIGTEEEIFERVRPFFAALEEDLQRQS